MGIVRNFTLQIPPQQTSWLLVAETNKEPRAVDLKGMAVPLDAKAANPELPAPGNVLVLQQDGGKPLLLAFTAGPENSRWRLHRTGNAWEILVRLPPSAEVGKTQVSINVWIAPRDDPATIKSIVSTK